MLFDDDHERFRATVREDIARHIAPHADSWESAGIFPAHELFPHLGAAGILGLEYDPAFGGQGADHSYNVVYGEEFGRRPTAAVAMAAGVTA